MLGFKQMGDRHLDSWHSLASSNPLLHLTTVSPILPFSLLFYSFIFHFSSHIYIWHESKSTEPSQKGLTCARWDDNKRKIRHT